MSWSRIAVRWRALRCAVSRRCRRARAHIRVTFQVDADGLLSVTAMEKSTGVEASIQVKPSYGLTDGEIATMIKDSMSYAEQDIQARMLAEQKVEAARVLESLTSALAADAALLSAAERQAIDAAAEQARAAAAGDDADAIKEAIKNIDTQTQEFAARRMDPVGPYRAERPIRGRGLKCQKLYFCPTRTCVRMASLWKLRPVKPFSMPRCVAVSKLNTPAKNPVPAPPATASCVKVFDSLAESSEDEDDMLDKAWGWNLTAA